MDTGTMDATDGTIPPGEWMAELDTAGLIAYGMRRQAHLQRLREELHSSISDLLRALRDREDE